MSEKGASMPSWQMPQPYCSTTDALESAYPLLVYNSLTRSKTRFIPQNPNMVTWYQCGPTVYAESHMGHARTYVSLDIIRRIVQNFLGYNVILCQNVTDIDDKIIIRSSERKMDFRQLATMYEEEFAEDMLSLGVSPPNLVTRVSEYVTEIVDFIQVLIGKDFAYESNGSVYFNVEKFEAKGHKYPKLVPEQRGNSLLLDEGEGALSCSNEKKNASDFALWKRTKEHDDGTIEPFWKSPWGNGRPGWHIECSVMCTAAMSRFSNGTIDVHAGGEDLKFPHHDNEIAQSEAYHSSHQWINYWLHTGHLNIKGFKMSKSLKNFITIRAALKLHSARQIRFCFLLHKYNAPMDYGDNTMNQAIDMERKFVEFFHNVKAKLREFSGQAEQHVGEEEKSILEALEKAKAKVKSSLLDDFDTPEAFLHLTALLTATNKYMSGKVVSTILCTVARYVTFILKIFGLIGNGNDIGFPLGSDSNITSENKEQMLSPYLDALTNFRKAIRSAAISGDIQSILSAVDSLRDEVLPELGIRMEDVGTGGDVNCIWKLDDPEQLRLEKALKKEALEAKELQKQEALKKQAEREEKAKVPPHLLFAGYTDKYSKFNDMGIPTHDEKGEELSKAAYKKLTKEYNQQKEAHEKYLAKLN